MQHLSRSISQAQILGVHKAQTFPLAHILSKIECVFCHKIPRQYQKCSACGYIYCSDCVSLKKPCKCAPKEGTFTKFELKPKQEAYKEELFIHCNSEGCETISLGCRNYYKHDAECEFKNPACPFCKLRIKECEYEEHKKFCDGAPVNCPYCKKQMRSLELKSHECINKLRKEVAICKNCSKYRNIAELDSKGICSHCINDMKKNSKQLEEEKKSKSTTPHPGNQSKGDGFTAEPYKKDKSNGFMPRTNSCNKCHNKTSEPCQPCIYCHSGLCEDCRNSCDCRGAHCKICRKKKCAACGKKVCYYSQKRCFYCREKLCADCASGCPDCNKSECEKCGICNSCEYRTCRNTMSFCAACMMRTNDNRKSWFCTDYCGELCSICEEAYIHTECFDPCSFCGEYHCYRCMIDGCPKAIAKKK